MTSRQWEQVDEFMEAAGQVRPARFRPSWQVMAGRVRMLQEELDEIRDAIEARDPIELVDGIVDLHYVSAGNFVAIGLHDGPLFDEVHRSNMSKFGEGAYLDEQGKWQKPASWTAPDIEGAIAVSQRGASDADRGDRSGDESECDRRPEERPDGR